MDRPIVGRSSLLDELDMDQVRKLAQAGWTDREMADFFKVSISTWYKWKASNESFREALKDWKDAADCRVERALYERAIGYEIPEDKIFNHNGEALVVPTIKHYPADSSAAMNWLKNRKPDRWRDRIDQQVTGQISFEKIERVIVDTKDMDHEK